MPKHFSGGELSLARKSCIEEVTRALYVSHLVTPVERFVRDVASMQQRHAWYSGVYSGGLWGLEHPPVLPDNHETNLAISSVLV